MNKKEILAYLSKQQKRTEVVSKLEKHLNQKKNINLHAKKQWNGTIVALLIFSWLMTMIPSDGTIISLILIIIGGLLSSTKFKHIWTSSQEIKHTEQCLEEKMAKSDYLDGLQDFPLKFYDYDSIYRLFMLIKEERASTLQEAYNILEAQLNAEHQHHLAEQNLLAIKVTERNARLIAITTTFTAYKVSKK